jgi:hypothetical protein
MHPIERLIELNNKILEYGMPSIFPDGIELVWSAGEYGLSRPRHPTERKYPQPQIIFGPVVDAALEHWGRVWCYTNGGPLYGACGKYYTDWIDAKLQIEAKMRFEGIE